MAFVGSKQAPSCSIVLGQSSVSRVVTSMLSHLEVRGFVDEPVLWPIAERVWHSNNGLLPCFCKFFVCACKQHAQALKASIWQSSNRQHITS